MPEKNTHKKSVFSKTLLLLAGCGMAIPTTMLLSAGIERWEDRQGVSEQEITEDMNVERSYRALSAREISYLDTVYEGVDFSGVKIIQHHNWTDDNPYRVAERDEHFGIPGSRIHVSSVNYCKDFTDASCDLAGKEVFSDAVDDVYNNLSTDDLIKSEARFSFIVNKELFEQANPGKSIEDKSEDYKGRFFRPLTSGEINLLKKTYGDYLSYDQINIVARPEKDFISVVYKKDGFFNTYGSNIHIGTNYYCDDFSSADCDKKAQEILIDEAVYIYGQQNENADFSYEGPVGSIMIKKALATDNPGVHYLQRTRNSERVFRGLTAGEIKFLKQIFEDKIDYRQVKIVAHRKWNRPFTMAYVASKNDYGVNGMNIHVNPDSLCSDFAAASCSSYERGILIHEVTHVYQNLNPQAVNNRKRSDYNYEDSLKENKKFEDFNLDEQAELVRDYYVLCIEKANSKLDVQSLKNPKVGQIYKGSAIEACDLDTASKKSAAKILHAHFNLITPPNPGNLIITRVGKDKDVSYRLTDQKKPDTPSV